MRDCILVFKGFSGGAEVKASVAMWKTWVQSLGLEDPLEKEMATYSSILAWRIPWMEELGGLQSTGRKESDMTELSDFTFISNQPPSPRGYHSLLQARWI